MSELNCHNYAPLQHTKNHLPQTTRPTTPPYKKNFNTSTRYMLASKFERLTRLALSRQSWQCQKNIGKVGNEQPFFSFIFYLSWTMMSTKILSIHMVKAHERIPVGHLKCFPLLTVALESWSSNTSSTSKLNFKCNSRQKIIFQVCK